jgi:hypothetical protein
MDDGDVVVFSFQSEILESKNRTFENEEEKKWIKDDGSQVHPYVCGLQCYNVLAKKRSTTKTMTKKKATRWSSDNSFGSPHTSMSILLSWLTTEGNYDAFKGDTVRGRTKERICDDIAETIRNSGVTTDRTGAQVQAKIQALEIEYKHAIACSTRQAKG